MEPINLTKFKEKRDGAFTATSQKNNNQKTATDKTNRKIDMARIKGLFEYVYTNLKIA